ncbi:DUF6706 family protein [Pedobacter agri]|uniref:Uncharacterized protein n=1 Tax=Pedobacter agri TaxID=454586 RepID=A0A9X3DFJ0_9SPHI|nr:DUF6706 family protein [Pedobacter agri]MCX3266544.1 hypothetical protein [Pedobacter agri]
MTIKEALTTKAENLSLSSAKIELALYEGNLDGATQYDPTTMGMALDLVYVTLLLESISISEVREDDVSIKYTNDSKGIVSAIYRKWGLVDPFAPAKPRVTQKQIW